ncbi:ABC transporter substrate-binding protein [Roseateles koreensis]|uniref:ABC transporter substrate-binding protein n=1 Tax=Roseateles koreensis TaxID=2987526 RepID=A0ABT5KRS2_9BURK|nr:ABC transporter substrate-binding protein [Roseateles koreensis]MDC8785547.1 ABC transporter substrate-binding protein [Roseateles koreensis]
MSVLPELSRRHLLSLASWLSLISATRVAGAAGDIAATEPSKHEIHIGSSAALSGPAAVLGQRFHRGARACLKQVNDSGGVGGMSVVMTALDDAYEPGRTEVNTRQLVEDARIVVLFGYVGTPTSYAAMAYVKRWKIPFVAPFTGADELREFNPLIYNVRTSYRVEAKALVTAMKSAGVRRLGILYQADLFGRTGMEVMRNACAAQGITIGATAQVQRNSMPTPASVSAFFEAPNSDRPDAIFLVSTYASSAAFIKKARDRGFQGHFYSLSFIGLEPLREALNNDFRKLTVAQVVPDPDDASVAVVAAYQKAMRAAGHRQFDSISLEGYIAARVLVEGLRRTQKPFTRDSIAASLNSLGQLDLGGFQVNYTQQLHQSSTFVSLRSDK